MPIRKLRIHGDNIVECERTLKMVAWAFNTDFVLAPSPVYLPKYIIRTEDCVFVVELLSGYGRWSGIDLGGIIYKAGGGLRECADSYLTEIKGTRETVLFAVEYCTALPAGGNAWQRNGRALACALANVPYLYCAGIGGVELDEQREPKAYRVPTPAVPFSFVALSRDVNSVCLPAYFPHPSFKSDSKDAFGSAYGFEDSLEYVRKLLSGEDATSTINRLENDALKMVEILSAERVRMDTLNGDEWRKLLTKTDRCAWLVENYYAEWRSRTSSKVKVSDTFKRLKSEVMRLPAVPITANELPLCIVPKHKLTSLKSWMKKTYKCSDLSFDVDKDLAIVWITGFKPSGEDARADRGLSPLCRMMLGKDAQIMAIVSGPAKEDTWDMLADDPEGLCKRNGLFESIFACCDYLFVDSVTCCGHPFFRTGATFIKNTKTVSFAYVPEPVVRYSEQDTDCAIHQILSHQNEMGVYECFCNPPGGDWSAISFYKEEKKYMWTCLPRVSQGSKRPDHIFQIRRNGQLTFVTIESKGLSRKLEKNVGDKLKAYVDELFENDSTADIPIYNKLEWGILSGVPVGEHSVIAVGAFLYRSDDELSERLKWGNLDAVFAFEFGEATTLHFYSNANGAFLLDYLELYALKQSGFVVKVHGV